ncbi:MAG: winged helix-turn-helix domain-containing protein [Clostridiales bacterium]|jgi:DNA-binding response OmpR family regulator|nr:winged helix-turn-helix domain-containing protein [Clostridiales bacterium]
MAHLVLGIGYRQSEYEAVRREWRRRDVDFHFVSTTKEAVRRLSQEEYICVTIFADRIDNMQIEELRSVKLLPIVFLSQNNSVSRRAEYLQRGIVDFLLSASQWQEAQASGKDAVQYYLDLPEKIEKPLTAVTTDDIYFCLEHRTVEVRGKRVDLTAKEFDILALLITHPKQVFTFDIITDLVWNEDFAYFSHKTFINHVSNLRSKLKVQPDVPNYIISIHGIGYKFDEG